ncbi:NADH-quinone oxidoreductase subunit N [Dissulfurispira thermophila]|uniref:NADH-quinone oxidoreductase subunit N n=2 Tax=root TaxID=1 RepID=A0A7G1H5K9_9BACT|nr:NADH-quinone oxidoreductase subunit N [Dissulfurispira thermophila]BCB97017.1 NADH-quinone oxidoreductase subunit N [Dissulfurispira thermophila]
MNTMNMPFLDLAPVTPEIIITISATVLLILELIFKNKAVLAFVAVAVAASAMYVMPSSYGQTFGGMFVSDGYSTYFKLIFMINLILTILISLKYIQRQKAEYGEYYSLLLFATTGMMLMASAKDLIILYLGLELMALSTYILAGIKRHDIKSNEAAMKYFLLGAFSSALLLYGISLIYGMTTTTDIYKIAEHLKTTEVTITLLLSMVLIVVAFSFKIAAAPFHMWAPDVYEGAPASITAFMSVGPKAAGFAVIGRVFYIAFQSIQADWTPILIGIAILTMAVGNILAIAQTNIKRMLAYSSIAHAGYMLIGIIPGTQESMSAMMVYMLIYAFMNIGAFAIVILLEKGEEISDYEGLSKSHPLVAALMLIFMFSLTGIPPTAGFIGKFNLFMAAVKAGYTWLVVIAVIFSAISAYYYLRIVMNMYMKEMKEEVAIAPSPSLGIAILITVLMIFVIGIMPSVVIG